MNAMQVFQNSEFGELGVLEIDGKPYFPANRCAKVLGYKRPNDALHAHCRYTAKYRIPHPQNPSKEMEINFIPEGDLYRLITHSKLPAAERFEKWVFDEVLPTIRKTGSYGQPDLTAIIMQTATAVCTEMVKQLTPLFQNLSRPNPPVSYEEVITLHDEQPAHPHRLRRKPGSIIDKLCPTLRREVEDMLMDCNYTYADIAAKLRQEGISISIASICRYAKRTGCYAAYAQQ